MQHKLRCMLCGIVLATLSFHGVAMAATLTTETAIGKIIEENRNFYKTKDGLQLDMAAGTSPKAWYEVCKNALGTVFRGCDTAEMGSTAYYIDTSKSEQYTFVIQETQIEKLVNRENLVDEWVSDINKELFQNGMSREDVIKTAYLYVTNNFDYDKELAESGDVQRARDAQGAYYAIINSKGICASLTKLFRVLVESVPFDNSGNVNWNIEDAVHVPVTIISSTKHEWAAIQLDGAWYHYDCSAGKGQNLRAYKLTPEELKTGQYASLYDLENANYER